MNKFLKAALVAAVAIGGAATVASTASATNVCAANDTGHLAPDTETTKEQSYTAPDGYLVAGYCVKAGSAKQNLGPEFYSVDPPTKSVSIAHSSGKDISHFSVVLVEEEEELTWCSPGFWKNQGRGLWAGAHGLDYNTTIGGDFGDNPTLLQVIDNPQIYGGPATNAVADYLSAQFGLTGTQATVGPDHNCPL